ncbi:MAG TPA: phosphotransferase [Thermoleophilaceae bacterium]
MSDLAPILARLGALLGAHGEPQALDGGITNRNFKVAFGGAEYVVRMPGRDTELLGIDRHSEWAATCAAAKIGVGPPTAAMFDQPPCLVTRFVEGQPVEAADLRAPEAIGAVAASLRQMHDSGTQLPAAFSSFDVVEQYARLGRSRDVWAPDGYRDALRRAHQVKAALKGPEHAPVPCHNDLLATNFIRCNGGFCIVDWEYAGMGDRYFDLGNFAVNNELDAAAEEVLLDAYFGEPPTPARRGALRLMRFMSDFREGMWGVVQSAISELDFDFRGYAATHFERLAKASADPGFDRSLKEARAARA